jgi:hypothetical protein
MKYLCLGYHDEQQWATLSQEELAAIMRDTRAYEDSLRARGHVVNTVGLQPARHGATLRFSERGTPLVTDGPFAETKEQLGGIMVLEASDLNHAIQQMSSMPCMRMGGSLEIRPINEELSS